MRVHGLRPRRFLVLIAFKSCLLASILRPPLHPSPRVFGPFAQQEASGAAPSPFPFSPSPSPLLTLPRAAVLPSPTGIMPTSPSHPYHALPMPSPSHTCSQAQVLGSEQARSVTRPPQHGAHRVSVTGATEPLARHAAALQEPHHNRQPPPRPPLPGSLSCRCLIAASSAAATSPLSGSVQLSSKGPSLRLAESSAWKWGA